MKSLSRMNRPTIRNVQVDAVARTIEQDPDLFLHLLDKQGLLDRLRAKLAAAEGITPEPEPALTKAWLFRNLDGCGDHGCLIKKPTGMGTNGGCRCKDNRSTVNLILSRLAALPDSDTNEEVTDGQ